MFAAFKNLLFAEPKIVAIGMDFDGSGLCPWGTWIEVGEPKGIAAHRARVAAEIAKRLPTSRSGLVQVQVFATSARHSIATDLFSLRQTGHGQIFKALQDFCGYMQRHLLDKSLYFSACPALWQDQFVALKRADEAAVMATYIEETENRLKALQTAEWSQAACQNLLVADPSDIDKHYYLALARTRDPDNARREALTKLCFYLHQIWYLHRQRQEISQEIIYLVVDDYNQMLVHCQRYLVDHPYVLPPNTTIRFLGLIVVVSTPAFNHDHRMSQDYHSVRHSMDAIEVSQAEQLIGVLLGAMAAGPSLPARQSLCAAVKALTSWSEAQRQSLHVEMTAAEIQRFMMSLSSRSKKNITCEVMMQALMWRALSAPPGEGHYPLMAALSRAPLQKAREALLRCVENIVGAYKFGDPEMLLPVGAAELLQSSRSKPVLGH